MIYFLIVLGLILLEVTLQPLIHIRQSQIFFLPVLILAAGAHSRWVEWTLYVLSLSIVSFFIPYSPILLLFLLASSYALSRIFSLWAEDILIRFGIVSTIMIILLGLNYYFVFHAVTYQLAITLVLNLIILALWFLLRGKTA